MLSQHYSDFLLSTIKTILKHKQVTHTKIDPLIISLKELDLSLPDLSFGGACSDNLSGHSLCGEKAHPVSHHWARA